MAGSERRQRQKLISFRCTDDEHATILALADKAGLRPATFCRSQVLGKPAPRSARHPTVNHQEIARLTGELGALAQTLRELRDDPKTPIPPCVLDHALNELSGLSIAALHALGRKP